MIRCSKAVKGLYFSPAKRLWRQRSSAAQTPPSNASWARRLASVAGASEREEVGCEWSRILGVSFRSYSMSNGANQFLIRHDAKSVPLLDAEADPLKIRNLLGIRIRNGDLFRKRGCDKARQKRGRNLV